jgi:hypothetical protein
MDFVTKDNRIYIIPSLIDVTDIIHAKILASYEYHVIYYLDESIYSLDKSGIVTLESGVSSDIIKASLLGNGIVYYYPNKIVKIIQNKEPIIINTQFTLDSSAKSIFVNDQHIYCINNKIYIDGSVVTFPDLIIIRLSNDCIFTFDVEKKVVYYHEFNDIQNKKLSNLYRIKEFDGNYIITQIICSSFFITIYNDNVLMSQIVNNSFAHKVLTKIINIKGNNLFILNNHKLYSITNHPNINDYQILPKSNKTKSARN